MSVARTVLRPGDPGSPEGLGRLRRPPRALYVMGDVSALTEGLGVVGSRKATPYGVACARLFGGWAAAQGVTVVSGAAIGCDLSAQQAALDAGGRTVAVLGCGADVDYPRSASGLLARLRAGEGAVVSEQPWGTPPQRWQFPERNRIIVALSRALLVVEAGTYSGTTSTVGHAQDCGVEVLAVPGSIFSAGSASCNRMLREGAVPISRVEDLADELAALGLLDPVTAADAHDPSEPDRDPVLRAALAGPVDPDDVAEAHRLAPALVLRRLAQLEQQHRIARYPDGRFGPCAR